MLLRWRSAKEFGVEATPPTLQASPSERAPRSHHARQRPDLRRAILELQPDLDRARELAQDLKDSAESDEALETLTIGRKRIRV